MIETQTSQLRRQLFGVLVRRCAVERLFFFFSSRRRHTRSYGDWSSDVCSSDLDGNTPGLHLEQRLEMAALGVRGLDSGEGETRPVRAEAGEDRVAHGQPPFDEIGRASCRERVESAGGGGGVERRTRRNRGRWPQ